MKPPFGFLILHGDGSHVMRLTVPRSLVYGILGFFGLAAGIMAGLSGEYVFLKSQAGELPALREEVSEQRAFIDSSQQRVVAVRGEIDSWKELHAKMWEPYGPDGGMAREPSGVGGPRPAEARATNAGTQAASLDEELDLLATTVIEEGPRLRELERVMSKNARIMAALPLRWPVRGPVNSEFGLRENPWGGAKEHHAGIDIGVPLGGPVKAPAAGIVAVAGPRVDYGNSVTLDHGNDVRSLYGHLSRVLVKTGDHVEKGQVIGLAGSTGRSTGPHLHYEVQVKGRPVNPRSFLWE
jgi:murein DD-endopeptidase MepM/ murein hydrolase activator NlpD